LQFWTPCTPATRQIFLFQKMCPILLTYFFIQEIISEITPSNVCQTIRAVRVEHWRKLQRPKSPGSVWVVISLHRSFW
jgi:hypothetical protein